VKLENFIVVGGFAGTTLFGLGRHWDLRSFAETRYVRFEPKDRLLVIEWSVPSMPNAWGSPGNRASGCRLVFENVVALGMTDRDPGASFELEATLADVARVVPGEGAYDWIQKGTEPERFRLRLRFANGRTIEVESERVRLEPIEDPGTQGEGAGAPVEPSSPMPTEES